ncbi:hypothetical protein P7C70_g7872, partial [Phenoliferia sp. Uapishka_3]
MMKRLFLLFPLLRLASSQTNDTSATPGIGAHFVTTSVLPAQAAPTGLLGVGFGGDSGTNSTVTDDPSGGSEDSSSSSGGEGYGSGDGSYNGGGGYGSDNGGGYGSGYGSQEDGCEAYGYSGSDSGYGSGNGYNQEGGSYGGGGYGQPGYGNNSPYKGKGKRPPGTVTTTVRPFLDFTLTWQDSYTPIISCVLLVHQDQNAGSNPNVNARYFSIHHHSRGLTVPYGLKSSTELVPTTVTQRESFTTELVSTVLQTITDVNSQTVTQTQVLTSLATQTEVSATTVVQQQTVTDNQTPMFIEDMSLLTPDISSRLPATLFLFATFATLAFAAGQACNPTHSGLDTFTHAFSSDCDVTEWCSPSPTASAAPSSATGPGQAVLDSSSGLATCVPRGCRTDEFPFG